MQPERKMWLGEITWTTNQLELHYGIDKLSFSTTLTYGPEVDLNVLRDRYGLEYIDKLFFHILAFEANKVFSLGPETLDPGRHFHWFTPAFIDIWQTIGHKVWAQWRYEHNLPNYRVPVVDISKNTKEVACISPVKPESGNIENLVFCGGGKDSLVAIKLMERAHIPFSTLAYAHSIYGSAEMQHSLIDGLLDTCLPKTRHKCSFTDTFLSTPIDTFTSMYGVRSILSAETPASIFSVLPLVLSCGYRHIILAHERSADAGNLIWDATGEVVNHQWGKSLEAETLINNYIQGELISDITYFSLLKPIHDVLIFSMLERDMNSVLHTHSCNLIKPWCKRCPKCAYVWLNYMAYLPIELVQTIFGKENLFDLPENQKSFRQMLGLEEHTPFECIGEISEAKLAFELVRHKGVTGNAMDIYILDVTPVSDWSKIIAHYTGVEVLDTQKWPVLIATLVLPLIENASLAAQQNLRKIFEPIATD